MPGRGGGSTLMRPFVVLALPGMYLLFKYNQYRQQQMETARRRVTERELTHLNTKILIKMSRSCLLSRSRCLLTTLANNFKADALFGRTYAKKSSNKGNVDGCRRALVDIPPDEDPLCPDPCKRYGKKPGILHRIKMRVVEGGTNFGAPFRFISCKDKDKDAVKEVTVPSAKEKKAKSKAKALPAPKKKVQIPMPCSRAGVQVCVLGAETAIGQYIALLLKQCPAIKKLRLYEAQCTACSECARNLNQVCCDLQNINTNCKVQAFSCANCDLERSLQNADIVLMLESGYTNADMTFEKRFTFQAPIVKQYADCIATECPKAFVIVCASPIDCMVPVVAEVKTSSRSGAGTADIHVPKLWYYSELLFLADVDVPRPSRSVNSILDDMPFEDAETLKETGWYDPRKVFGSLAVPEMRASTLAARALCLEPRYTRVPCVGGSEGESLVPLFSKAVEYFDFAQHNALLMTDAVRAAPAAVSRTDDGVCLKQADLSEAHALAKLVVKVAHALLCQDIPRVTGFVETDPGHVVSPARFLASAVELNGHGISRNIGLPKMSELEIKLTNLALNELNDKLEFVMEWYTKHSSMYFGCEMRLNDDGICKQVGVPGGLSDLELELLDEALYAIDKSVCMAHKWFDSHVAAQQASGQNKARMVFLRQDKLLNKLEENEPELATSPEEECVICVNAKATMQTSPCGHRVVCRRCFVKTIQMAVSQRLLPLRCVICRAKILRLRQAPRLVTSKSWQVSSSSGSKSWGVPGSVSSYSVGARSVPASASLYSVTSGESSLSGVSSVSSNSGASVPSACSTKLCGGAKCGGACLGAVPRSTASAPPKPRQPASNALRRSQHHSMKARLQEYNVHSYTGGPAGGEPSGRLPPIREFQREFREGRRESTSAATASASTRIRCAQKIVTQLETSPQKNAQHFFRPLKPSNKDDPPKSTDQSKETEPKKDNPKTKPKKDDKKDDKPDDKHKKDEANDNKKNETAEKKKEEKLRLKAEKEAKKEAKQLAKEEERQAKLLAKEEEKQAKLLAKEEKKKAKKEAKLAAQAEKEKNK